MTTFPQQHGPATIACARQMYAHGARIADICAATGMAVGALYYHLDGRGLPGLTAPKLARRRVVRQQATAAPNAHRRARLAARLLRAAESQARVIETHLANPRQTPEERAADLTALAQLAGVLRALGTYERGAAKPEGRPAADRPQPGA
jgi:AcrR family transcriptional regulator